MFALVDFYNLPAIREKPARLLRDPDFREGVASAIDQTIRAAGDLHPKPTEITLRLYGAWHAAQSANATDNYGQLMPVVRNYPTRRSGYRVKVQIAQGPIEHPGIELENTLRVTPGLPIIRFNDPYGTPCGSPANCRITELAQWQKGRCPAAGCAVTDFDAVASVSQKTVDTLLCCDLLSLAFRGQEDWLAVLSDDDDMVPGLLAAAAHFPNLCQIRPPRRWPRYFDDVLEGFSIRLFDWTTEEAPTA